MSVGDEIRDSAIRHRVYLLRYAKSTYRKHSKLVDQSVADLIMKITARAPGDNTFTAKRLNAMLENIKATSSTLYKSLYTDFSDDLKELAEYESRIVPAMVEDAYPIKLELAAIPASQIHAAAMSRPFQGKILKEWFRDQEYGVRSAFQAATRLGYTQGESIPQIVSRLRGVGDMTQRQVESVIRTAVTHMSQTAMTKLSEANSDIVKQEEWVSTLDGRTTLICASLDGKRYAINSGPQPPQHFNCRSIRVPVPESWATLYGDASENTRLDSRPYVADKRRVKDIPKGERDSIIGSTDAKNYNEWLRTQKKPFIEDVLGKKKAKLYLDGDLSLDKFVDRNGNEYTLIELEKRERKAFKKAGIETD